jgi:hypothetical protein
MVFELLDFSTWDPVTIGAAIVAIVSIVIAMYKGYQKSGIQGAYSAFIDGMTSNIPQTEAQTKAILAAPAATWKMTDETKSSILSKLRLYGGEISNTDLLEVIAKAESEAQVEYGIILTDPNGEPDVRVRDKDNPTDQTLHVFVSYGRPVYGNYDEVVTMMKESTSKAYTLPTKWIMSEFEKDTVISEIGTSYPKCISAFINTVAEAEAKQVETYSFDCNNHCWVISKGNVTKRISGAKTGEPSE